MSTSDPKPPFSLAELDTEESMSPTVKNSLLAGVAGMSLGVFFMFVSAEYHQKIVAEAQSLELRALLLNPERYDSLDVSVTGFLMWDPNEPTLFANKAAREKLDFGESIQLEMDVDMDFRYADESPVTASGIFLFDAEYGRRLHDYKGVFRVKAITKIAQ